MIKKVNLRWFVEVPGFNMYLINRSGDIYTKHKKRLLGKFLCSVTGYYKSNIEGKSKSIHRLLAITFVPNPDNLPVVAHINDVKTDNRLKNLRWSTHSQNSYDKYKNGYIEKTRKLNNAQIKKIYFDGRDLNAIASDYGVCHAVISRIKRKISYKNVTENFKSLPQKTKGHRLRTLNNKQVKEIFRSKLSQAKLAKKYRIGVQRINWIKNKKAYKDVTKNLGEPGRSDYGKKTND